MNDRDYYLARATQEDAAAHSASSLTARWRHEELAGLYRLRAARLDGDLVAEPAADVVPAFILLQPTSEIAA